MSSETNEYLFRKAAEIVIGGYMWNRITSEAKASATNVIAELVRQVTQDYSNAIRHLEIGDAWSITEDDLKKVEDRWTISKKQNSTEVGSE